MENLGNENWRHLAIEGRNLQCLFIIYSSCLDLKPASFRPNISLGPISKNSGLALLEMPLCFSLRTENVIPLVWRFACATCIFMLDDSFAIVEIVVIDCDVLQLFSVFCSSILEPNLQKKTEEFNKGFRKFINYFGALTVFDLI